MSDIKISVDYKQIESRLKYADFFAGRGIVTALNGELENIKNLAFANLYPLKGVSEPRPGMDINSNWHIRAAESYSGFPILGILYNSSPHAGYHEVGTGAYAASEYFGQNFYKQNFIYPKNSQFLRFTYNGPPKKEKSPDPQGKAGTSEFIYAKYVEGQEPKRYLGNAVLALQPQMLQAYASFVKSELANLENL